MTSWCLLSHRNFCFSNYPLSIGDHKRKEKKSKFSQQRLVCTFFARKFITRWRNSDRNCKSSRCADAAKIPSITFFRGYSFGFEKFLKKSSLERKKLNRNDDFPKKYPELFGIKLGGRFRNRFIRASTFRASKSILLSSEMELFGKKFGFGLLSVLVVALNVIVDVDGDCRPFGQTPLTFGTFFPAPSQLTGLHGTLTSPNYPNNYNSFEQCTYIIWAPTGSNVTITFQVRTATQGFRASSGLLNYLGFFLIHHFSGHIH